MAARRTGLERLNLSYHAATNLYSSESSRRSSSRLSTLATNWSVGMPAERTIASPFVLNESAISADILRLFTCVTPFSMNDSARKLVLSSASFTSNSTAGEREGQSCKVERECLANVGLSFLLAFPSGRAARQLRADSGVVAGFRIALDDDSELHTEYVLPPTLQPPPQRILALSRSPAGQKALDADVLIQIRPMNSFTASDEAPIRTLRGCPVRQAREPGDGHGDGPAV